MREGWERHPFMASRGFGTAIKDTADSLTLGARLNISINVQAVFLNLNLSCIALQ